MLSPQCRRGLSPTPNPTRPRRHGRLGRQIPPCNRRATPWCSGTVQSRAIPVGPEGFGYHLPSHPGIALLPACGCSRIRRKSGAVGLARSCWRTQATNTPGFGEPDHFQSKYAQVCSSVGFFETRPVSSTAKLIVFGPIQSGAIVKSGFMSNINASYWSSVFNWSHACTQLIKPSGVIWKDGANGN